MGRIFGLVEGHQNTKFQLQIRTSQIEIDRKRNAKNKKGKSGIGGWVDGHQTEPRARHLALPLSQVTPLTNFDNI